MPATHLTAIKSALTTSVRIASFVVVEESIQLDSGYIRVRATLDNGDFLEASEYFSVTAGQYTTIRYWHQWMDADRTVLRKRWDNVPHYPGLANFPHHIHLENGDIAPGQSISIVELIVILESQ